MKFLDRAKILVSSGAGGDGSVSFRREKYVPRGGPDGGDGGRGGNVVVMCVDSLNTLIDYRYCQHFRAGNGRQGMGRGRSGARGTDVVVRVPVGTQIFAEDEATLLADFTRAGESAILARGGNGGYGNRRFKSSRNRAPRRANRGLAGQEFSVWLRLKSIADVGIIGFPNAGKSTFFNTCVGASSKVGAYPFTTLHPVLGVLEYTTADRFIAVDIPGFIAGAHKGAGLGHRFLGHVERCQLLVHLLDSQQEEPAMVYRQLRDELEAYGSGLADKPEIIVLSKTDLVSAEVVRKHLQSVIEVSQVQRVISLSAHSGEGMENFMDELQETLRLRGRGMRERESA